MESVMMCRLCHQSSGVVHIDLFESFDGAKYIEQIWQYLSLKVGPYDGLSHLICHLCVFDLSLCSQLSETYSSTYCPGIILKSESNLCCCICSASEDTVEVDKEITKLIEKAKNCLSYEDNCLLLKETATKFLCRDCLFKLNEVGLFYLKVHRDGAEKKQSSAIEVSGTEKISVKKEKAVEEEEVAAEEEEEEEAAEEDDDNNYDDDDDSDNVHAEFKKSGQKSMRLGPSTTRRPKKEKPRKTCPICKNKSRSNRICKECEDYAQSVKVSVIDLRHCKKL